MYTLVRQYLNPCSLDALSAEFMFDYGWNCKRHGDVCVMIQENVNCDGSLNLCAKFDPLNPVECYLNGNPKLGYTSDFSGGMIHQFDGEYKYGYFEALIKTPTTRGVFPAFWLFGGVGGAAGYNEIDIMEHGVGDVTVHTSQELNATGFGTARAKWNYSLPGQVFSAQPVLYGLRWDKNKVVWYINGIPVKIMTDIEGASGIIDNHVIPDLPMSIILNHQIERYTPVLNYLPKLDSSIMQVYDLNVYQRNDTFGNVDFYLNGKKGQYASNPVLIQAQEPCAKIKIDLTNSYIPLHTFYIEFTMYPACDTTSPLFSYYYWIKPPSNLQVSPSDCRNDTFVLSNIYEFDLNEIFSCDWTDTGDCFKVTIGAIAPNCKNLQCTPNYCGAQEYGDYETNYFKIIDCNRKVEFKLNGINTTCQNTSSFVECLDPIVFGENHGKSRIIMDVTGTQTCENDYFISIEKSDSIGGRTYIEKILWLTNDLIEQLPYINIDSIWIKPNIDNGSTYSFEPGCYYRIKLATGSLNTWKEKVQLIKFAGCTINAQFSLNGFLEEDTVTIDLGEPIEIDATYSEFCSCDYIFRVKDQLTDSSTWAIFQSSEGFYSPSNEIEPGKLVYKFHQGDFDLYHKVLTWDTDRFNLECNRYYKLILEINDCYNDTTITASKIIHINECNPNSDFTLYGEYCEDGYSNEDTIKYKPNVNVSIWSPEFRSCNFKAQISIAKIKGTPHPIVTQVINNQEQITSLRQSGDFNLSGIILNGFGSNALNDGNGYIVTLTAFNRSSCDTSAMHVTTRKTIFYDEDTGCGTHYQPDLKVRKKVRMKYSENLVQIFPNPTGGGLFLSVDKSLKDKDVSVEIYNSNGSRLLSKNIRLSSATEYINEEDISLPGIYLIKIKYDNSKLIVKKVLVHK